MDNEKVPENPPAFPFAAEYGHPAAHGGMSLRDWFAGQALTGLCANPAAMQWDCNENDLKVNAPSGDFAAEAYAMADAMLANPTREG